MAYIQISQILSGRGIEVTQRSEDIIAEQRFLGNLAKLVKDDGSILLHINSSDGYWGILQGGKILQVAVDKLLRRENTDPLYGGSGFVRMYPGDAIEYWIGAGGPVYVVYHDEMQGLRLMDRDSFVAGQRPSKAV